MKLQRLNQSKYNDLKINIEDFNDLDIYLKNICTNIYNLIYNYCEYYNYLDFEYLKEILLHNDNIKQSGQVRKCDIDNVISNGNIRERTTLIYMFGLNGSKIISSITLDDDFNSFIKSKNICYIDDNSLNERYKRLTISIGLTDKKELIKLYNNDIFTKNIETKSDELLQSSGKELPCLFASLVKYGCGIISKNTDFPFNKDGHRISINNEDNLYNKEDIYPPLSDREMQWFIENNAYNYIPWKCGTQFYKVSENSIYKKIADIYNQKTLTGISGTTDLVIDVMTLFTNYNLEKSLHASLIWQCSGNIKDHSIYEVLVATIPYGLNYTVNIDAEEYCRKKNIIIPYYY